MFTCNNLFLLTFTYYLKIFLALCMTIIPFILIEIIIIKLLRYKKQFKGFNYFILKKSFKNLFYTFTIFILAFIIHNVLNTNNNVCYKYSKKNILNEYKLTYNNLKDEDISENVKKLYLENALLLAYNKKDIKKKSFIEEVVTLAIDDDEINLNETNFKKQNSVYVENGIFYYPKNSYSGLNCSNNPVMDGYNNPYGYNNYFYSRLQLFIEDAKKAGYKITMSNQGCRSYQTQVNYYYTMVKGRAASPGYSLHGFGIASDLEFYLANGSVCPYNRTDISCPSMGWAHNNASKYGLTFPLLNASYKEDWHIEPLNKRTYW